MRHSLIRLVLVVTCVTGSAILALAQQSGTGLEVADYRTVPYIVAGLSDDAAKAGLDLNRLRTRLELRLRQADLVPLDEVIVPAAFLYLEVLVVGEAFSIELQFRRPVSFSDAGLEYRVSHASVWQVNFAGTHTNDAAFIIDVVDQGLDQFLNQYLKVNQG